MAYSSQLSTTAQEIVNVVIVTSKNYFMLNMIFDTICTEAEPKSLYFKTELKLNLKGKKKILLKISIRSVEKFSVQPNSPQMTKHQNLF